MSKSTGINYFDDSINIIPIRAVISPARDLSRLPACFQSFIMQNWIFVSVVTQIPNVLHKMTPATEERALECMCTAGFWELRIPNSQHHFEARCVLGISEIESVQGIHICKPRARLRLLQKCSAIGSRGSLASTTSDRLSLSLLIMIIY